MNEPKLVPGTCVNCGELFEAIERHLTRLDIFALQYDTSRGKVKVDYEWLKQPLVEVIAKAEGR